MAASNELNVKPSINAKSSILGTINGKASLTGYVSVGQVVIKDDTRTYILVDENGNEIPAVLVDEPVELTATPNDIRIGTTAVTGDGVVEGTKEIPSYHTSFGWKIVANGSKFVLPMNNYEYTKLQVIFCPFNTSLANSVAAEKVVIDDNVYTVGSTNLVSVVTIDTINTLVDFGIINDSGKPYILRYSSYKEIY